MEIIKWWKKKKKNGFFYKNEPQQEYVSEHGDKNLEDLNYIFTV